MSLVLLGLAAASSPYHLPHGLPALRLPKISPPSLSRSDTHAKKKRIAGWTLYLYKDSFTGITSCRLYRRKIAYEYGKVSFQFSASTDTSRATYRIDGGPVLTSVAPLETFITADLTHLGNPSRGRVLLPAADLAGASQVAIRPRYVQKARTFHLKGLNEALAAARERGCPL